MSKLLEKKQKGNHDSMIRLFEKLSLHRKMGEILGSINGNNSELHIYINNFEKKEKSFIQHNDGCVKLPNIKNLLEIPDKHEKEYCDSRVGVSRAGGGAKFTMSALSKPHDVNYFKKIINTDTYENIINSDNLSTHSFMMFKAIDNEVVEYLNNEIFNPQNKKANIGDIISIFYPRTVNGIIKHEVHLLKEFKDFYKKVFQKYMKDDCNVFWSITEDVITTKVKHSIHKMFYKCKNIIFNNKIPNEPKQDLIGPSIVAPFIHYNKKIYIPKKSGTGPALMCYTFRDTAHLPFITTCKNTTDIEGIPHRMTYFDKKYELDKQYWFSLKCPSGRTKPLFDKKGLLKFPPKKPNNPNITTLSWIDEYKSTPCWEIQLMHDDLLEKYSIPEPSNIDNYELIYNANIKDQNIPSAKKDDLFKDGRVKDIRLSKDYYDEIFLRSPNILLECNGCIVNYDRTNWTNDTLPECMFIVNKGKIYPIINVSDIRGTRNLKKRIYNFLDKQNILRIIEELPVEGFEYSVFSMEILKAESDLIGIGNKLLKWDIRNKKKSKKEFHYAVDISNFYDMQITLNFLFHKKITNDTWRRVGTTMRNKIDETYEIREKNGRLKRCAESFFKKFPSLQNMDSKTIKTLLKEHKINLKKNKSALEIQRYFRGWYCRQLINKAKENERINKIVTQKTQGLQKENAKLIQDNQDLQQDKQSLTDEVKELGEEVKEKTDIIKNLQHEEPELNDDELLWTREIHTKTKYNLCVRDFTFEDNEGNKHLSAYGKCLICQTTISASPLFRKRRRGCISLSGGHVIPHTPRKDIYNKEIHKRGFQHLNNMIPLCPSCNSSMGNEDARVYMRKEIKACKERGDTPQFDKDKVNKKYGHIWKDLHILYKSLHGEEYYLRNHLI